ncbi:MAG: isochorismatase family protein [bacterium]|nr:isochorismatase family protein [bacterium]
MELADADRSVVVVIDLQGKLMDMVHRPALVKATAKRLLRLAELFEVPVVLTEQYPRGLGETHPDVLKVFEDIDVPKKRLAKISFGCCGDASFEQALSELRPEVPPERRQLIVVGIEAHVCVMQTVIESLRAGNQVQVCWEGVSGRGAEYRRWALERMQQAGAVITNHESVAFEWARDKDHPRFKAMSAVMKEGQPSGE